HTQKAPDWSALISIELPKNSILQPVVPVNDLEISDMLLLDFNFVINIQKEILSLNLPASSNGVWSAGRLKSIGSTLIGCYRAVKKLHEIESIETALKLALAQNSPLPLLNWLDASLVNTQEVALPEVTTDSVILNDLSAQNEVKFGRRNEDVIGRRNEDVIGRRNEDFISTNAVSASKTLKVDQEKLID
ncbi:MAG: hypothetical protein NTZ70_00215, partial [Methylococcales bacterium]|nr:hypothetical protein [Methylococcales bacterium]